MQHRKSWRPVEPVEPVVSNILVFFPTTSQLLFSNSFVAAKKRRPCRMISIVKVDV